VKFPWSIANIADSALHKGRGLPCRTDFTMVDEIIRRDKPRKKRETLPYSCRQEHQTNHYSPRSSHVQELASPLHTDEELEVCPHMMEFSRDSGEVASLSDNCIGDVIVGIEAVSSDSGTFMEMCGSELSNSRGKVRLPSRLVESP